MKKSSLKNLSLLVGLLSIATINQSAFASDELVVADAASAAAIDQLFTEGMSLRDAGNYEAAIADFQGILSSEPSLGRARAELAVTYLRALNFTAAREEAEKVIADPNTPDIVRLNMQYFLSEMEKQSKTHVFTPYVNFGFGHDDNINAGPSVSTVDLGGGTIGQLANGSAPISKSFYMLNVGLGHRYLSPTPIKAFGHSAAYIWQSNVSYYRNDYLSSNPFDLDVLSLSTGPLAIVAERWRVGADFTYDYISLGHKKLADFYGIAPSVTWNVSKFTDITLSGKYQKRDFKNSVAAGRSSDYESIDLSAGRAFLDAKLNVTVGASLFNESADVSRFSNHGQQVSGGVSYSAWEGGNIYAKDAYKHSIYRGNEVLFTPPQRRNEYENRVTVGANHRFTQKYIKDWTVDANVTYTNNDSNLSPFTYDRTQFSVTFGKYF